MDETIVSRSLCYVSFFCFGLRSCWPFSGTFSASKTNRWFDTTENNGVKLQRTLALVGIPQRCSGWEISFVSQKSSSSHWYWSTAPSGPGRYMKVVLCCEVVKPWRSLFAIRKPVNAVMSPSLDEADNCLLLHYIPMLENLITDELIQSSE